MLNAEDKFNPSHANSLSLKDLDSLDLSHVNLEQVGELGIKLLNDKNLEVSKVRPFFWSLVEAYVDRFHQYPFDVNKALFSHLELNDYAEQDIAPLVKQLESEFEQLHGRPLLKSAELLPQKDVPDDEIKNLRDSLKYAAMVAEEVDE